MADKKPMDNAPSQLATNPPLKTTPVFRQRPAKYGQIGRTTAYISTGEEFTSFVRPTYYQLAAWDNARKKEPIIKDGMDKIIFFLVGKLGDYHHPNSEIMDFINANLTKLKRWISELATPAYWAGYAVSEILYTKRTGKKGIPQVWFDDLLSYHPTQLEFKLNKFGRLTHGEKIPNSQFHTGIWVPCPIEDSTTNISSTYSPNRIGNLVRLPRSNLVYTSFGAESSNPFGTSQLTPVLEYHLFKEAFKDMMATALDRYGTPLIYAVVPPQQTGEIVEEPDGTTRGKAYREVVAEALSDLRSETAIVFEQLNNEHPVKLDSLTTSNNFADAFKEAIDMCDHNMMTGMGIPNLIVRDTRSGLGSGNSSETQIQMFDYFITSIYDVVVNDFVQQAIGQLISYNFDARYVKDAYLPGEIKKRPFRIADLESLVKTYQGLVATGFLDPEDKEDFKYVRDIADLPTREPDVARIKELLTLNKPNNVTNTTGTTKKPKVKSTDSQKVAVKRVSSK